MDSWDHYRTLLGVLAEGSLSGAARTLGLSQPTVGRHIEALEAEMGTPLFTRSASGLAPTEAALALRPHAEAMAAAAEALVRTASGERDSVRGVVRLTAAEIVGVEVLPPVLTAFREAHPDVTIELALSNRQEDLLRREADIGVRMVRPTQGALLARRVGAVRLGLYAHRRYIEAHGLPETLEAAGHAAIGFDRDRQMLETLRERQISLDAVAFAFRSDADLAQLAVLRAGFGIGACHEQLARRNPDLVPVLQDQFRYEMEVWVAMHEDLKTSRRMRLMFDWLVDGLGRYVRE
ncbi:LysR family transcriptional regulator [Phenylobacterium sp.]|jgi:DNA-binding transcriptional LysR family regulator|uniref:LysR family transcriptional regulator n=1 Tax=Phenylobacterium sp. TaxID=1871053 RepID=UPI002F426AFA